MRGERKKCTFKREHGLFQIGKSTQQGPETRLLPYTNWRRLEPLHPVWSLGHHLESFLIAEPRVTPGHCWVWSKDKPNMREKTPSDKPSQTCSRGKNTGLKVSWFRCWIWGHTWRCSGCCGSALRNYPGSAQGSDGKPATKLGSAEHTEVPYRFGSLNLLFLITLFLRAGNPELRTANSHDDIYCFLLAKSNIVAQ